MIFFNKTALHIAIEKGNTKIVEILLSNSNINVNASIILKILNS